MLQLVNERVRRDGLCHLAGGIAERIEHRAVRRVVIFDQILKAHTSCDLSFGGTLPERCLGMSTLLALREPAAGFIATTCDVIVDDIRFPLAVESACKGLRSMDFVASILIHLNSSLA